MVTVDVLIIGAGPHALTLATLLSRPNNPDPNSDDSLLSPSCSNSPRSEPHPGTYSNRCSSSKKKRRPTTERTPEERPGAIPVSRSPVPPPLSLQVVDSYGEWTTLWESQFTALSIPHLRSHVLVHTDPLNKRALEKFVVKSDRSADLHCLPDQVYILDENAFFNDMRLGKKEKKRLNITSTLKKSLSFSLPGTKLSVDFFKDQVERYNLDGMLMKGTVERIVPVIEPREEKTDCVKEGDVVRVTDGDKKKRVKYFQVQLREGITLKAHRVVMATGPTRAPMANIPSWVKSIGESYPEERLQHTVHLMHCLSNAKHKESETLLPEELCVVCERRQRVMVVGGGLTSAHVVSLALQRGASHVTWVMRKHLQLKQFDVGDVEGLVGRYSHVEHGIKMDGQAYLRQFYGERSLHKRLAMIRQARKGGAVTPEAYIHLQPFILKGQVDVRTYCQVSEATWCYKSQAWSLSLSTGDHWTGDMIWLATGCKLDVNQDPLLSEVIKDFPIQVGPHAVNLAGGQAASKRITEDIMRHRQQDTGAASELNGEKSKTREYIQQMQGLLWL